MFFLESLRHLPRLLRAGFVLGREGVFLDVDPALFPPPARPLFLLFRRMARPGAAHRPDALAAAMTRLGPTYIKLGQFLSTRPDIVGMRTARSLESLQDRVPAMPRDQAIAIVERAFGEDIDRIFISFSDVIAAASVAQVHRAKINAPEGECDVAVKILRPGVEGRFRADLSDMAFAARVAEYYSLEARRLRIVEVVEIVARSVRLEMDFRLEAAAASEFAANTANDPDFRTPKIDWDRTSGNVLTLEWIDGIPLSDLPRLQATGVNLRELGRTVIQSFLRQALRDGLFHADMHQGNLFLDRNGRLAAVDFGIMGRLSREQRKFLAEVLFGFITKDYYRVALIHFEAGYVPATHTVEEFAQAIRAIGEPIHSRTADQISMAKLLNLLFEITALFDMRTRPELVLLQKTMMTVEGVSRKLDPQLDMWSTAEPVARAWIEDNLGPAGLLREARANFSDFTSSLARMPKILEKMHVWLERATEDGRQSVSDVKRNHVITRSALLISLPFWAMAIVFLISVLK